MNGRCRPAAVATVLAAVEPLTAASTEAAAYPSDRAPLHHHVTQAAAQQTGVGKCRYAVDALDHPAGSDRPAGARRDRGIAGRTAGVSFWDVHQIRSVSARVDGPELGEPRPVRPPVRSGSRLHPAGARPVLLLRLVWTVDLLPTSGSTRAGGGPALV